MPMKHPLQQLDPGEGKTKRPYLWAYSGPTAATTWSPVTAEALRRIADLYALDWRARALDAAVRQLLREQKSLPKLQALHDRLQLPRRRHPEPCWPPPD
jgi:hypothetical protein